MKPFTLSLLCAGMLVATSCSQADQTANTNTPTDSEEAGGNAGDNYMNNATSGDAGSTNAVPTAETTPEGSADAAGTAPADDTNGYTAPLTDPEFMNKAAMSDQNEIQLSRLALEKGVTGMAKDHANMMIKDHTKSTSDLKAVATEKNVVLPTTMDPEHQQIREQMSQLSGKDFEQRYMAQMETDHQKTVTTMQAHQQATKDADVKGFIGKTLPVVQNHLAMFKKHSDTASKM